MRKLIALVVFISLLALGGCAQEQAAPPSNTPAESVTAGSHAESADSLVISASGEQFTVSLADTDAACELAERLKAGPVTVNLHAYGGFEQVGTLPWSLPTSDEQITTSPGDVMLYQGNQITIFTGSNSWTYTSLGSIEDATSDMLLEAFGDDTSKITLSLA